jgi:osmotically-inducible protein OsmY
MSTTAERNDETLKSEVTAELRWTPSINSAHIGVAVDHGAVTLSGEVDSYPELLLATKAAQRVHGVTALAQDIQVRSKWGAANDTDIAREAGEAVDRAVDVPDSVKVQVRDHIVTLTGSATWQHEGESAARAVRYIKGVRGVHNEVVVRPTVGAAGIKTSITAALVRGAQAEGKNITVTANEAGVVTLEGSVGSWSERRQAEHVTWSAPGVTGLVDHLRVAR